MKNNIIIKAGSFLLCAAIVLSTASCKKALEVEPGDAVSAKNAYRNLADADAAVIGVYGKFIGLGKQYILLNELRADLMDVTANADPFLQQVSSHTVTANNPYTDPKAFYEVILYCNDVLKNFNIMKQESRMSVADYNMRYSDIGVLRSWIYLQLGIHYGSVPYITEPIESIDQARNVTAYPKIPFNQLLDSLDSFTSKLPYISEAQSYPTGTSLVAPIDGINTSRVFINKTIAIGDINLWKGDYLDAAKSYKIAMLMNQFTENTTNRWDGLRIVVGGEFPLQVGYSRGSEETSLTNSTTSGWRQIFGVQNTARAYDFEWYWGVPYSTAYAPGNPFIELFSPTFGKYLLQPSKAILDLWNRDPQRNGIPYDARMRLSTTAGLITTTGQVAITKLTDNITSLTDFPIPRGGLWNIYRAAGVHLRFSEAANRDGYTKLGWALLNVGINETFSPSSTRTNPITVAQLDAMQTPYAEPYYFDARNDVNAGGSSAFRQLWHRNAGIRARANMPALSTALQTDVVGLEDKLIEEGARELAFEGARWSDLLRISVRRNDPSFLAERVYQKLLKAGDPNAAATRAKLMAKDWYLPFKL